MKRIRPYRNLVHKGGEMCLLSKIGPCISGIHWERGTDVVSQELKHTVTK